MSSRRPLCLLDVDGVLVPYSTGRVIGRAVLLVRKLARTFELVWCTEREVGGVALPGLGPFPVMPLSGDRGVDGHSKLESIDEFAADWPLVWFDDHVDRAVRDWEAARAAPTLVVRVNGMKGLTEPQVARARRWAVSAAAPAPTVRDHV